MKIITHKFKQDPDTIKYLVNLVDPVSGHPLESHLASNVNESRELAYELSERHEANAIQFNTGFSIMENNN